MFVFVICRLLLKIATALNVLSFFSFYSFFLFAFLFFHLVFISLCHVDIITSVHK